MATTAPHPQESPVLGVLLHAVVAAVHHQEMTVWVEGNPGGSVKCARPMSRHAPLAQEVALLVKDGDALQRLVRDVDMFFLVEGNSHWPHDLAVGSPPGTDVAQVVRVHCAPGHPLVRHAYGDICPG